MAPPERSSAHPITAHYLFIDLERMKGWGGLVGWPCSGRLTHISGHPSAAGRAWDREKFAGHRPTFYHCATQPTVQCRFTCCPSLRGLCNAVLTRLAGVSGQYCDQHSSNRQRRAALWSQLLLLHSRRQPRETSQHHVHVRMPLCHFHRTPLFQSVVFAVIFLSVRPSILLSLYRWHSCYVLLNVSSDFLCCFISHIWLNSNEVALSEMR